MKPETMVTLCALFVVAVVWGVLAVLWDIILERFICWELTWNHPEDRPWAGHPDSWWGPRLPWLCKFADWITGGECHD